MPELAHHSVKNSVTGQSIANSASWSGAVENIDQYNSISYVVHSDQAVSVQAKGGPNSSSLRNIGSAESIAASTRTAVVLGSYDRFFQLVVSNSSGSSASVDVTTQLSTAVKQSEEGSAVTVSSSALPSGAATGALQTAGNSTLSTISGKIVACNTGAVAVSSSALPSGAAEQGTLSALNGKVTSCDTGAVVIASGTCAITHAALTELGSAINASSQLQTVLRTPTTTDLNPTSTIAGSNASGQSGVLTIVGEPRTVSFLVDNSSSITASQFSLQVQVSHDTTPGNFKSLPSGMYSVNQGPYTGGSEASYHVAVVKDILWPYMRLNITNASSITGTFTVKASF